MLKQGKYTNNVVHNQQNTFNLIRAGILQQTSLHISEVNTLHLTSRNLRNNFSRHKTEFATLHDKSKFQSEISLIQYGKEREDKALLVNAWLCIERNLNKRELVVYGQRRSTLKLVGILQLFDYLCSHFTVCGTRTRTVFSDIIAGSLEAAYSLNWGAREIWGKGGGETLALL